MADKNFDVQKNNEEIIADIGNQSFDQILLDNERDVIHSYVTESVCNKGMFVLIVVCRNGEKFVVAGEHHVPTYLKKYDKSLDVSNSPTK